jgi:MoxR-like ATPase
MNVEESAENFRLDFNRVKNEIGKFIVGNEEIIEDVLICLLSKGNVLLEGVPGLGKTYLVKTLSEVMDLSFSRIQFTPDLMPADIIGTNFVVERDGNKVFEFQKGPVFANVILADEVNRATPKTQSALLEAMQEHQVSTGGQIRKLDEPFFVLATQNPIEMEGTYPLPEAQLDRFFFKLKVEYPNLNNLSMIMDRTTKAEVPRVSKVISKERLIEMQDFIRDVPIAEPVQNYALKIVLATHPTGEYAIDMTRKYVKYGASPRGCQALILSGKARALLDERYNVSFNDIKRSALGALRHRIILNFEGEAEGIHTDSLIDKILVETQCFASLL